VVRHFGPGQESDHRHRRLLRRDPLAVRKATCCASRCIAMNIAAYVAYFLVGLLAGVVLPSFAMWFLG